MSNILASGGISSQKESSKQQLQQQNQIQMITINGGSSNQSQQCVVNSSNSLLQQQQYTQQQPQQQSSIQLSHTNNSNNNNNNSNFHFSTQSPILTSSLQHSKKITQKIQLKISHTPQTQPIINSISNQTSTNLTNQQQSTQVVSNQNGINQTVVNQQSQSNQAMQILQPTQQQQQQQQLQIAHQTQQGQQQNNSGNGSGSHGGSQQSTSLINNNCSSQLKKGSSMMNEDNGIYMSQNKKLLQIIQKQQREQQEFEKQQQQQQALGGGVKSGINSPQISEELSKNHKRNELSSKTNNKLTCIRTLLKKYKRSNNAQKEEKQTNQNNSQCHILVCPQILKQNLQFNPTSISINSQPIKRANNPMTQDSLFMKNNTNPQNKPTISSESIIHPFQSQQEEILTEEKKTLIQSKLINQEQTTTEEQQQDNFDLYSKILDEDDLIFLKEIEDMCAQQQCYQMNEQNERVLSNKNCNNLTTTTTSSSSSQHSSIIQSTSPRNQSNTTSISVAVTAVNHSHHSKMIHDTKSNSNDNNSLIINSSSHTKENDYPKVKEIGFKRIIKNTCSGNQNSINTIQQQQQQVENSQLEKKNLSRQCEFFQRLETEDSLATTHLSALSNCTPHSLSQNLLNFFSPLNNSSAGSTINFNNTNGSLKQAIEQSLSGCENNSLIYEQIKQQIDSHNLLHNNQQESEEIIQSDENSTQQVISKDIENPSDNIKKAKVMALGQEILNYNPVFVQHND